jgi:Na+/melibiose symporter-like transporter
MFATYIPPRSFLGVLTIVGLVGSLGYFFSSLLEPVIANWSERAKFRFGRRRTFLAIACFPFALFSVLVFLPPFPGSDPLNVAWLAICILLLYFFMTMYVTPFNALINELTHTDQERLHLVMLISITFALGYGIGNGNQFFLALLEKFMPSEKAFKLIISAYGLLAFLLMLLPVIFIDEKKMCAHVAPNTFNMRSMIREVYANRNFRTYSWVELLSWIPNTVFMLGTPYFITVLLKMPKEYATYIVIIAGIFSFLLYPLLGKLVKHFGNKKVLLGGFAFFFIAFLFISRLGKFYMPPAGLAAAFVLLTAFPIAVFGIIPMALTGDIAEEDGKATGVYKNAAFFGMKSFMMKIGISVSQLIFPSLLLLGHTRTNDAGIRASAIFCAISCVIAFIIMLRFKENS